MSEDENYPHSVSLVDIDNHGGEVRIQQLKIDQLRHFKTLPENTVEPFATSNEAISYLKKFVKSNENVYIRLRFLQNAEVSADFNSIVYDLIDKSGKDIRYNPRMIFVTSDEDDNEQSATGQPQLDIEEIKQMTNPREFVRKTAGAYPGLTEEDLDILFGEVEEELKKMNEEE